MLTLFFFFSIQEDQQYSRYIYHPNSANNPYHTGEPYQAHGSNSTQYGHHYQHTDTSWSGWNQPYPNYQNYQLAGRTANQWHSKSTSYNNTYSQSQTLPPNNLQSTRPTLPVGGGHTIPNPRPIQSSNAPSSAPVETNSSSTRANKGKQNAERHQQSGTATSNTGNNGSPASQPKPKNNIFPSSSTTLKVRKKVKN
jgi:hypothetical protein